MPEEIHTPEPTPKKSLIRESVEFAIIVGLIVVPFRLFVAQPFVVNGASMSPTFENGDYLIVDQISYHFENPDRGDVIIFKYPLDPTKFFIKRVIGLPGETVEIKDGAVTIFNAEHPEGVELQEDYIEFPKSDRTHTKLEADELFVMGDNRAGSSDSRIWGPLKRDLVIGRPIIRLLPFTDLSVFPGLVKL